MQHPSSGHGSRGRINGIERAGSIARVAGREGTAPRTMQREQPWEEAAVRLGEGPGERVTGSKYCLLMDQQLGGDEPCVCVHAHMCAEGHSVQQLEQTLGICSVTDTLYTHPSIHFSQHPQR